MFVVFVASEMVEACFFRSFERSMSWLCEIGFLDAKSRNQRSRALEGQILHQPQQKQ